MNKPPGDTVNKVTDRNVRVAHGTAGGGGFSYAIYEARNGEGGYLASYGASASVKDNRLYDLALSSSGVACQCWLNYDWHAYKVKFEGTYWGLFAGGGYDYILDKCTFTATDAWITSVATIMKILEQKGFLASRKKEKAHVYTALVPREEYEAKSLRHLTENLFQGDPATMVMKLLDDSDLSRDELKSIRALLDERLRK